MIEPPIPDDEAKRLALLRACHIIYTPAEEAFDDLARLAAEICGTEIALITLVDSDYQWFKARVGVEQEGTSRDLSFCGHCINHQDPLVVEDTHKDARFVDNPLVTGEPRIRFYAGVPLLVEAGSAVGAISVADRVPRQITPRQMESLQRLARQIARELRLRRDLDRAGANVSAPDFPVGPGAVVAGRWRITRLLGRGGTGAVFEAQEASGERVAIKVLLPELRANAQVVERFAREARVLMRLRTPHVGKLLEVGNLDSSQGGLPFLALEYLEGTDLARLIESKTEISVEDACGWCADACEGVAEAHSLGVVHRDLKPSNIFLASRPGGAPVAKVLDFGIAAGDPSVASPSQITKADGLVGSPCYMAPEQMLSASGVDARSDVWSMGAVLYELLTGAQPFAGDSYLQICANVMTKPPLPLRAHGAHVPSMVEALTLRCLRRAPEQRPPSMAALASELRRAVAGG
jgi:serine/threonine-protein kinase